jgi:hypothetical protein
VAVQQATAAAVAPPAPVVASPTVVTAPVVASPAPAPPAPIAPVVVAGQAESKQGFWSKLSDFLKAHGLVIGGSLAVFVVVLISLYMWQNGKSSGDDKKKD